MLLGNYAHTLGSRPHVPEMLPSRLSLDACSDRLCKLFQLGEHAWNSSECLTFLHCDRISLHLLGKTHFPHLWLVSLWLKHHLLSKQGEGRLCQDDPRQIKGKRKSMRKRIATGLRSRRTERLAHEQPQLLSPTQPPRKSSFSLVHSYTSVVPDTELLEMLRGRSS